ncbi:MAG TPA: cyclic nucleotide-binding domain-containing protein [Acidobacteriota bacterium]|jgi:CRP-like cAMP-binding protein
MAELNLVEKVIALEAVDLLAKLKPDQLARIASIAKQTQHRPGELILDAAQPSDALYVILDGEVAIDRDGETLHTAKQYEVLGAWALFDEDPLPVGAKAVTDVSLLRIGRDDFYDLLSDNVEITAAIFSTLVKRFRKLVEAAP